VGDEALADDRALAGDHGEDTVWQAGLPAELPETDRGQRRELGRLEDDGVAGGQCGSQAPAGDGHREVPRNDDADDPERLVERDVDAAGDRDLVAGHALGGRRVVVQDVADVARLPRGVAPGVAGVADLQLGQLIDVLVDHGGEAAQQPRPLAGRHGAPRRVRLGSTVDGRVGLLDRRRGDLGDGFLGSRIDDDVGTTHSSPPRESVVEWRRPPAAADAYRTTPN
jgi:hypothetical protein